MTKRAAAHRLVPAWVAGVLILLASGLSGCSPDSLTGSSLPPNVPDPGQTHTPQGAVAAYEGAEELFRTAFAGFGSYVPISGLLADELGVTNIGAPNSTGETNWIDSRAIPPFPDLSPITGLYSQLQQTRGQVEEARGLLRAYDPDSANLLASLDVMEGYAEVFLADFFCSGIPLSTVDYNGDYTLKPGSTTAQVYTDAAALFDSALTFAAASPRVLNAARVGLGRADLGLGQFSAAAQSVAAVPSVFSYVMAFSTVTGASAGGTAVDNRNFAWGMVNDAATGVTGLTMVDKEGEHGLPFMSSGDPRTAWIALGVGAIGNTIASPAKYGLTGDSSVIVASGVEARLIQAEAALKAGDPGWLAVLNALRTDSTFTTMPDSVNPAQTDTLWNQGSGGVAGLAPLADPGTLEARVDLVFRERAFWLFLTGHRQGDLRRLVRQYGRVPDTVYPSGQYLGANGAYGSDVTAPIPQNERISNPYFAGCFNRGA